DVVILPDNDDKGRAHAEDVARRLTGVARRVRIVALPGLPDKGDISDWLAAGHRSDELRELLSNVSSVGSVSSVGGSAEADMWPIPIELDDVLLGLEFPIDALPDVLRDFALDVARITKVPVDLPALGALAAVGAAVARRAQVKIGFTHTEPLNRYTAL